MRGIRSGSPLTKNFDNYPLCAYNGHMKKEIKAYAAGIFDGEGYIGIDKVSKSTGSKNYHYGIRVIISQKDGLIMDWLKDNFGGNVYHQKREQKYSIYRWRIHSKKAVEFLKNIYPYVLIKKSQIDLAIKFDKERIEKLTKNRLGKDGKFIQLSEQDMEWRVSMKEELMKIKKIYNKHTKSS